MARLSGDVPDELLAWADRIARKAIRGLPPCFELDDLCQVARMEVCKRLPAYEGAHKSGAPVEGYLYKWVLNACRMAVRRREWRETVTDQIHPNRASKVDHEADAHRSEGQLALFEALTVLPPRLRQLMRLRMEGVDLRMIGWIMGSTPAQLRHEHARAIEALRQALRVRGIRSRADLEMQRRD